MFLRKSWMSRWSVSSALFLGGALSSGVLTGSVMAYQSHMQAALQDLNATKQQLSTAVPDKAGHRVKARELVEQAISETKAGIAAGR